MSAAFALPFFESPVADGHPSPESKPIHRQVPSLRNREIFAAVVLGKSHAEAAAEFKLTQPRVTQIMEQVRDWMTQVTRGEDYDYTEIQKLRLAEETLRVQLDGWMRMAMEQWFKSCQESFGRTTFLNQAARLSANLARLAGVDVTGKTARTKAEQQGREEALKRLQAAEKPLWVLEPESSAAPSQASAVADATPDAADVCEEPLVPEQAILELSNNEKNSYGLGGSGQDSDVVGCNGSARVSDPAETSNRRSPPLVRPAVRGEVGDLRPTGVVGCVSQTLRHPTSTPTASMPADKPIPKFLDKKVRKRLLALRREQTLAAMRVPVG